MKRMITDKLVSWKDSKRRKPLLLTGVRQCGKTYSLKAFGQDYFENTVYVNFEESRKLSSIFDYDYDIERILRELCLELKVTIQPGSTLLILTRFRNAPGPSHRSSISVKTKRICTSSVQDRFWALPCATARYPFPSARSTGCRCIRSTLRNSSWP